MPVYGLYSVIDAYFADVKSNVRFNEKVISIDYSGE